MLKKRYRLNVEAGTHEREESKHEESKREDRREEETKQVSTPAF